MDWERKLPRGFREVQPSDAADPSAGGDVRPATSEEIADAEQRRQEEAKSFEPDPRPKFEPLTLAEIEERFDFTPHPRLGYANDWYTFCELGNGLYEYPSVEFIAAFSGYLNGRAAEIKEKTGEPTVRILEVGAGKGILAMTISEALSDLGAPCELTATDNGSRFLYGRLARLEAVYEMDYKEAVEDLQPHIIIGAWIDGPNSEGELWPQAFRACPTVQEYILLGRDIDYASHPLVWGKRNSPNPSQMPFAREGFKRVELHYINKVRRCYLSTSLHMNFGSAAAYQRQST